MAGPEKENQNFDVEVSAVGLEGNSLASEVQNKRGALEKNFGENKEVIMDPETINKLKGNKKGILAYLKENCMIPKEGEETEHVMEYGVMGIHYRLILPSVNGSECKKIDWFVSDKDITREEYEGNKTWVDNSSSAEDVSTKLFGNIRDFLDKLGVSEDIGVDFAKKLFEKDVYTCDTGRSIKKVTGLKDRYFLKKDSDRNLHVSWECDGNNCHFSHYKYDNSYSNLLLGLSVS